MLVELFQGGLKQLVVWMTKGEPWLRCWPLTPTWSG
jgi:hypothetical protein